MKILQIGPVSYVGGVSVHIKRLYILLNQNINSKFDFIFIDDSPPCLSKNETINLRKMKHFVKYVNAIKSSDIIHIHSGHWLIRLYNMFFSILFKKPFIVTIHSFRLSGIKKYFNLYFLKFASKIIVVNSEISELFPTKKYVVVIKEAFLPPDIKNEIDLPTNIFDKIQQESKTKKVICANAFRLTLFDDKHELYGLDQCIEIAKYAKAEGLEIFIVFVIGTVDSSELLSNFEKTIKDKELDNYIWIVPKSISFVNLIRISDIVLRPTLSDGDALTVREALFLNKTVIASDVVNRPKGTITYKTGNSKELYNTIKSIIITKSVCSFDNSNLPYDYTSFYTNLYATTHTKTK